MCCCCAATIFKVNVRNTFNHSFHVVALPPRRMRSDEPGSERHNWGERLWGFPDRETVLTVKMQLHFTKDVLPDSVSTDFQNLNKLNQQVKIQSVRRNISVYPTRLNETVSVQLIELSSTGVRWALLFLGAHLWIAVSFTELKAFN